MKLIQVSPLSLLYASTVSVSVSASTAVKGQPGRCGSLIDFVTSETNDAFPDNTVIKYKNRGKHELAQVTCTRMKKKGLDAADADARKVWERTLSKRARFAKYKCSRKDQWKVKDPVPDCAHRSEKGSWAAHHLKKDFQVVGREIGQCLSFSTTETMAAYHPAAEETGVYPLAVWTECNEEDPNQSFTWDLQFRLKANGMCLTPLPISYALHQNLDYCDTTISMDGAGTYLFAIPCGEESGVHQQFKFNRKQQSFVSQCEHRLSLGKVENDGNKAFLTHHNQTYISAEVLTGMGLDKAMFR